MATGFCAFCGTQRVGAGRFCGGCGQPYPDLGKCPTCGQQLPANQVNSEEVSVGKVGNNDARLEYGESFKEGDCVNCGSSKSTSAACAVCGYEG